METFNPFPADLNVAVMSVSPNKFSDTFVIFKEWDDLREMNTRLDCTRLEVYEKDYIKLSIGPVVNKESGTIYNVVLEDGTQERVLAPTRRNNPAIIDIYEHYTKEGKKVITVDRYIGGNINI